MDSLTLIHSSGRGDEHDNILYPTTRVCAQMGPILGRGRFAEVIKEDGRAVKIIDVDMQRAPHSWRAEVAALERLSGTANIVEVISVEELLNKFEPEVCIVFPVYAYTLEHLIFHFAKASWPPGTGWRNIMPQQRVVSIVHGIAYALAATHAKNILHRDVKPENILFASYDSEPFLADFGIAWVPLNALDTEKGNNESEASVGNERSIGGLEPVMDRVTDVCSAEYKAPELLCGKRDYTEKIDMWALGCILARLLGHDCQPLFGPYRSDLGLMVAQRELRGEQHLKFRSIDPKLEELALKLLSFNPEERPSAQQVLEYLDT